MKRPNFLLRWVFAFCVLLVVGQYAVLAWLVPRFVLDAVAYATGGNLVVRRAHLTFPMTTTLEGVRLAQNTEGVAFSIERVVIRPRWASLARRTLWLDSLDFDGLLIRASRSRAGTTRWPAVPQPFASRILLALVPWRLVVASVNVKDGVVEFLDRSPAQPFHGALDHVSLSVGPVVLPPREAPQLAKAEGRSLSISFALRGRVTSAQGTTPPWYCSGWVDLTAKDLQASCHVDAIPLAAFEPYFTGRTQLRAYATTLRSTSYWTAKANDLTGRVQLELGHLLEGDFSVRGRTVVDVKKLAGGPELRLSGAVVFNGPLDKPGEWDAEFLAGDPQVQLLVKRLFEYGVRLIKVPFGSYMMYVRLAPVTPEMKTDVEAVSREVQEALELLIAPPVEEAPPSPTLLPPAATVPAEPSSAPPPPAAVPTGNGESAPAPSPPPVAPASPAAGPGGS